MSNNTRVGIIAGEGDFPFLVAQGIKDSGSYPYIVAIKGHTREEIGIFAEQIEWIHLGQLGRLINFFKISGVEKVIFAGAINKPRALEIRPDLRAAKLLFKLRSRNDNALLEGVIEELEAEGLEVVSPLNFVPSLQTPPGVLTRKGPSSQETKDILFGWPIAKKVGEMDIGQTLVVKGQMVIAVEALEGTNETIKRAGRLVKDGAVVIKIFKPGQLEVVDQPSVGPGTIEAMREAGASCLAVEAKKSLFFEREKAIDMANRAGISIIGITDEILLSMG